MTSKLDDDIIMKENIYNTNYNTCNRFNFYFSNYIRPRKRTFLQMLHDSNQTDLNYRIENYKLNKKFEKKENSDNNENNNDNILIKNFNDFSDINKSKKNLMVKKRIEYDEEKERKWVENYYRIKNAELNRLRFGTD